MSDNFHPRFIALLPLSSSAPQAIPNTSTFRLETETESCPSGSCPRKRRRTVSSGTGAIEETDSPPPKIPRAGRRGRVLCGRCRQGRHGWQCVEDGREHSRACIQCEKDGFTAQECGAKTLPKGKCSKRKRTKVELQQEVLLLNDKVNKMNERMDQLEQGSKNCEQSPELLISPPFLRTSVSVTPETSYPQLEQFHSDPDSGNVVFSGLSDSMGPRLASISEFNEDTISTIPVPEESLVPRISTPDLMRFLETTLTGINLLAPSTPIPPYYPGTELALIQSPAPQPQTETSSTPHTNMESHALFISTATRSELDVGLLNYLVGNQYGPATNIRATTLKPSATLLYKNSTWRIMAWNEGEDVDVMAISKPCTQGPSSVLLHYGIGRCFRDFGRGKRWKKGVVGWYVREPKDIEELAMASRQFLMDIPSSCSKEKMFVNGERRESGNKKSALAAAKGNEVRGVVKRVVDMLIRERSSRIDFRKIAKDLETFSEKELNNDIPMMRASKVYNE